MVNVVCPSVRYSEVVDIGIYDGLANTKDRFGSANGALQISEKHANLLYNLLYLSVCLLCWDEDGNLQIET